MELAVGGIAALNAAWNIDAPSFSDLGRYFDTAIAPQTSEYLEDNTTWLAHEQAARELERMDVSADEREKVRVAGEMERFEYLSEMERFGVPAEQLASLRPEPGAVPEIK